MLAQGAVRPDRIRPLRRLEYESLVAQGLLDDTHVELLLGTLVERSPQGPRHADAIRRLSERFIRELPRDVQTRVQSPLALSDDSEPEPDIAVVPAGDYRRGHPTQAHLVVEVADTSLDKDRGVKAALYATAAVPEFWLVNLAALVFEVHRRPVLGRYETIERYGVADVVAPDAFSDVTIAVRDVLD